MADSQVLRWLDELNGITDADSKAREIKSEIRRLRKEQNSVQNRRRIKQLYVYGWWEGHEPTEDNAYRSGWTGSGSTDAYIRSRKDREGLQFIQQAVQDFNGNYGSDYNVVALAGDDYQ